MSGNLSQSAKTCKLH